MSTHHAANIVRASPCISDGGVGSIIDILVLCKEVLRPDFIMTDVDSLRSKYCEGKSMYLRRGCRVDPRLEQLTAS